MGRALTLVSLALVACFAILAGVVVATRGEDRVAIDNLLAEDLTRTIALAEGEGEQVVVADLTDFAWDRMLLVRKGTPTAVIDRALGFPFKGDFNYTAESSELLIFASGRELAKFADYRGQGEFRGVERPIDVFTPETAVFEVRSLVIRPARG